MKSASLFALSLLCGTGVASLAHAQENAEEKALRQAEAALCDAFHNRDAATIQRIEDEHYTLTDSRGGVTGRDSDMAEAKKGDPHYNEFHNHSQKFRFYGDTAVVNGITSLKGVSAGKAFAADFQFTDTWVKRNGEWKIVASHATRIAAPAKPD